MSQLLRLSRLAFLMLALGALLVQPAWAQDDDDDDMTNIDWIGRWTVLPSYVLIMAVMLTWVPSALT